MNYYPDFTRMLNLHLQKRDRSPTWLARQLGINPGTVSRWLNQEARPGAPEMVIRVADLLGVHEPAARQALLTAAGYGYQEGTPVNVAPVAAQAPLAPAIISQEHSQPPNTVTPHRLRTDAPAFYPSPPFMAPTLPPQGVLGREEALLRLQHLLALDQPTAVNVPPVALHGMGGIGKTTLALALARQTVIPQLFPDGVLWVGVGPQPTIRNLLDDWGQALGLRLLGERDEAACQERLRTYLHQRRLLLVIDDVWEVAHGQHFLVGGPYCRTILTTRESPVAYTLTTRERTQRVDVLEPAAALALLHRLAPESVVLDEGSARRLCERLEFLPLALTLAGRLLALEADIPQRMQRLLHELIARGSSRLHLAQAESRLGLNPEQPASLHAILGMSVERLSPVDQERFAMLTVFGAEPLTWQSEAAAHVWECSLEEAEKTIASFLQRGLVLRRGESYWMHALLVDYATVMMMAMG